MGFKEVHTKVYKVPFEFEDMASYMRSWYGAQNPVADQFKASFKGSQEEAKRHWRNCLGRGIMTLPALSQR